MENRSTNFATEAKAPQILRPDLPGGISRPVAGADNAPPIWLSTAGYFLIALTVSLGLFFIVWGLMGDEGESEIPLITAGLAASIMMGIATAAREVVLRRARTRYLLQHDQFSSSVAPRFKTKSERKFTLEQNSVALRLIQRKANEADLMLATAEKHLEVFKISQEYLEIVENELSKIKVGSPRLPALRNGQETIKALRKRHLLKWAAAETRSLLREANVLVLINEKIETSHRALEALDFALKFYPDEQQLLDSRIAVQELTTSIRVTHWVELAEREAFKGHFNLAADHYKDALFYLSREAMNEQQRDLMTAKIRSEIERLNLISEDIQEIRESPLQPE